ncbi:craniofacial development protein 2-like [Amphiura filiformis]|uniref:craniofacial development protein 2-like n=1 Tax=Amphiura filiformis TaxID=82378 RepID=UPI003B217183
MPTTSHKDDAVYEVYEEINGLLNQDKASHTIIMGDFNAKVGSQRAGEQVDGKFGIGERNDRGDKFLDFAVNKGFRIMNTFFKKKPSRQWTWRSPIGTTKNEIDLILSDKQHIVTGVSVLNKFNTGSA